MAAPPQIHPQAELRRALGDLYRRGQITRREFLRRTGLLAVPLAAPAAAAAIRPGSAAAQESGVLRISYGDEPTSMDKMVDGGQAAAYMTSALWSNMLRLDAEANIVPNFAESWDVSDDGLVYTFHLRPGVMWSDNSREITAADVKFSWDRYFWPETESPYAGWGLEDVVGWQDAKDGVTRELAGAKVIDDHTFEVTLVQPSGIFLDLIAYPETNVVKRENVEAGTVTDPWWREPVSSGPYMVESWTVGQELALTRNPHYFGDQPAVEKVVYRFIPDASAITLAYENGDLDMAMASPEDIRATFELGKFEGELINDESLVFDFLCFKVASPPVDDVHVRRALTLAIDRELLNEAIFKGASEAAKGWEPTSAPWYNPDVDYLAFDPERAQEEAAQSSYGPPSDWPPILFLVAGGATGGNWTNRMTVAMQAMWQENLGVNVEIKAAEDPWQAGIDREGQMLFGGISNGYYDPHYVLDGLALCSGWMNIWSTGYPGESATNNFGGYIDMYCRPELDELIKAAKIEVDPEKRLSMYHEAEQLFLLDAPVSPIAIRNNYFLVKPYVKGLYFLPVAQMYLEFASIEA